MTTRTEQSPVTTSRTDQLLPALGNMVDDWGVFMTDDAWVEMVYNTGADTWFVTSTRTEVLDIVTSEYMLADADWSLLLGSDWSYITATAGDLSIWVEIE